MHELLKFDYYYGKEAEQYSFYRVPKMLIKDKHFSGLSDSAKILYGLMLDRMGLSIKNEWQDDLDRTYIIYTVEDVMEDLNCSKTKAVKTMTELDVHGGIGLIEKVRRGLGKPDIIYVKNFVCVQIVENDADSEGEKPATPHKYTEVAKMDFKKSTNQTSRSSESGLQEVAEMDFKESTNQTSRSSNNGLFEVAEMDLKKSTIETSRSPQDGPLEVAKMDSNYNDLSNTDMSENEYSDTDINDTKVKSDDVPYPIHPIYHEQGYRPLDSDMRNDDMAKATEYLHVITDYDALVETHPFDKRQIDEIIQLMVETILSRAETIRINGADVPQMVVRSKFEKYDSTIIEYVLECLKNNTSKVKNIRSYLLTTLYNAPTTIESYYQAEVQHDMYSDEKNR